MWAQLTRKSSIAQRELRLPCWCPSSQVCVPAESGVFPPPTVLLFFLSCREFTQVGCADSLATCCSFSDSRLAQGTESPISCCLAEELFPGVGGGGSSGRRRGTSVLAEKHPPRGTSLGTQQPAVYGHLALLWQEAGAGAHSAALATLALLAR